VKVLTPNGISVLETVRRANPKMIRFLLEWLRPDKWGKHRKVDVPHHCAVLVIGADKPKNSTAASVKARKWKARMRMIRETKA
jgi:hypothetical protein